MVSPTGARASKCNACIALSFMVGIPRGSHRFAVRLFRDANTSERLNSITVPLQCMDCLCLLLRSVPDFSVHSRGFLARIFGYSSNGKNFAAVRAGQQTLQGFHLVPSAGLPRLHDTHLKSTNVTVDGLPIDGKPFRRSAGNRTNGLHRRHLLCLLSRFLEFSRVKDQGNVCPLSR